MRSFIAASTGGGVAGRRRVQRVTSTATSAMPRSAATYGTTHTSSVKPRRGGAVRAEIREVVDAMPDHVREPLRDTGGVQDTLDSLFEIQERLFRWRYPDWHDFDPDEERLDFVAS